MNNHLTPSALQELLKWIDEKEYNTQKGGCAYFVIPSSELKAKLASLSTPTPPAMEEMEIGEKKFSLEDAERIFNEGVAFDNAHSDGYSNDYAKKIFNLFIQSLSKQELPSPIKPAMSADGLKTKKLISYYSCNADCPDVEFGNCCHPDNCQKEIISATELLSQVTGEDPSYITEAMINGADALRAMELFRLMPRTNLSVEECKDAVAKKYGEEKWDYLICKYESSCIEANELIDEAILLYASQQQFKKK